MVKRAGIIYRVGEVNKDEDYNISTEKLKSLAPYLVGLPVLVEHDPRCVIGRVEEAVISEGDGSLGVVMEIDRNVSPLLLPELSMRHDKWSFGPSLPTEVSFVREGARKGCVAFKPEVCTREQLLKEMDTVATTPAAAAEEAPAAKKLKATTEYAGMSHENFLSAVLPLVNSEEAKAQLLANYSQLASTAAESVEKANKMDAKVKQLEEEAKSQKQRSEAEMMVDKSQSKSIMTALRNLFAETIPELTEETEESKALFDQAENELTQNSLLRAVFSSVPVCASRVSAIAKLNTQKLKMIGEAEQRISAMGGCTTEAPAAAPQIAGDAASNLRANLARLSNHGLLN